MDYNAETTAAEHSHSLVHRDDTASRMGMWLFLLTEVLLFGGLFLVYAVYRFEYTDQFRLAALDLNTGIGALNTAILLTSSLTMALAIAALQRKNKFLSILFMCSTLLLALIFLVNKFFEWKEHIEHGLYPGAKELLSKKNGEILFYGLYYVMTGLHGLHVIVGMVFICFMLVFVIKDKVTYDNYAVLENAGLYWHLVDLIWIFLFPLFYLIQ